MYQQQTTSQGVNTHLPLTMLNDLVKKINKILSTHVYRHNELESIDISLLGNQLYSQFDYVWRLLKKTLSTIASSSNHHHHHHNQSVNINVISNALITSECLVDRLWEHLNIGDWKKVKNDYRILYAFSCLIMSYLVLIEQYQSKTIINCNSNEYSNLLLKSLFYCDMGLIMSPPIMDAILANIAAVIHQQLIQVKPIQLSNELRIKLSTQIDLTINPERCIDTVDLPSLMDFNRLYFKPQIPIIINGATGDWQCLRINCNRYWTIDYLLSIAAYRTVSIELGQKYTDDSWSQKLMKIHEFIERHFVENVHQKGYLAQQELFTQINQLSADFTIPDYCCLTRRKEEEEKEEEKEEEENEDKSSDCKVVVNAWFGPWSTVSPLHHDSYDNLFTQVIGCKYIRLYSNTIDSHKLYPHNDAMLNNTSKVDLDNYDYNKYPLFQCLPYQECVLRPGQMLFIPKGYWHYVKSLSTSFSINFWWI